MFFFKELLGLKYEEIKDPEVWQEDVTMVRYYIYNILMFVFSKNF